MLCPHDGDAASAIAPHGAAVDREICERSLVARVLAGDASAFLDLVNRHHGSMVRLAVAWGHDAQGAEQVARCAWRTILQRLSAFDGAGSLSAWLLRLVSELASATAPPRHAPDDHDAAGPGIPAGTIAEVSPDALHGAIAALPVRERVAITLRDIEGLRPDEAAAVLGVTVAAQHALLHRARTAVVSQIWDRA